MKTKNTLNLAGLVVAFVSVFVPLRISAQAHGEEVQAHYSAPEDAYRVFLIGDSGIPSILESTDQVFPLLKKQIAATHERSSVVFLGDNLYCCGLPDSGSVARPAAERRLSFMLESVKDVGHKIVVIPGNHDWNDSKPGGLEAVKRQAKFVESFFPDSVKVKFAPKPGLSGPAKIKLTDEVRLIAVDTEWWLTNDPKEYGDGEDFSVDVDQDLIFELDRTIRENMNKDLLVVGHHPIYSGGTHGGYYPSFIHFTPPVLGSLFMLYARSKAFSSQDLQHPRYREMRAAFDAIFQQHPNLIYASGHEHNLQHFEVGPGHKANHYVVSGAGANTSYVSKRAGASFATSSLGYSTIDYYDGGDIVLTIWTSDGTTITPAYAKRIRQGRVVEETPDDQVYDSSMSFRDSTTVTSGNKNYAAGAVKRFFWGSQRRTSWTKDIRVPLIDLATEQGGLVPTKRGGGMQTVSLRLESDSGSEFVLRMVDKDPSGTVPASLQGTIATDIVQDQIASIHPYGALVVPSLAERAGIYHPKPKLVYIPDDPRLGEFRTLFANKLALFEQRPKGDMSDRPEFGNSKKIVSAADLYEEINGDNDHVVDAQAFMKVRLFDMLLSDWDRHRDQWRWASFKDKDEGVTIYRPIGRDRDWAFNRMNGLLTSIYTLIDPRFQDFTPNYGVLKGLTGNGHEQDRRFTASLERQDWIEAANFLQQSFTRDDVLMAFHNLPTELAQEQAELFTDIFFERLGKLDEVAEDYYEMLARIVDVVGSDKHERFAIECHSEHCDVAVIKTSKKGEARRTLWSRRFVKGETKQIRFFGQGGNDNFVLNGDSRGISLISVGGPGDDSYSDLRTRSGRSTVYDDPKGMSITQPGKSRIRLTADPEGNRYDTHDYKHNSRLPQFYFGYNRDDGVFLGGGIKDIKNGFRKDPFKYSNTIVGNFAASTRAYNVKYEGVLTEVLGDWDVGVEASALSPNNIRNFYGLGNETGNVEEDRTFYQAQLRQYAVNPFVRKRGAAGIVATIRGDLSVTNVDENEDRFIGQDAGVSSTTFEDQWFSGVTGTITVTQVDHPTNPKSGLRWETSVNGNVGLRNTSDNFARISTDMSVFVSPSRSPQITLAVRAGADRNFGDFPFYSANTLGGKSNLRGFRSTRFAGRSAFYQNVEVRAELFRYSTYFAIGSFGVLGFLDNGRVWTDGESSSVWHQGYGGGAWTSLFDLFIISGWAGFSDDDNTISLKFGFQF